MQQPAPQPSTPDSRIQQPTVPTVPLQPVEKTRPIYPGGIPPGYPAGAPPLATRKRGGSRLVIAGCVAAAVLLVCGGLYFAFSTDDKSTHSEWDDEETAFVEEYAEPEFSDVMLSGGSSSAPFDYTAMVCFRELTPADLTGCPKSELRLMRSTIYARHGYTFQSQDLREYFSQFDWYVPRANVVPENEMSDTELKNIALIKRFE